MDNEILGDGTDALVPVALPLNQPSSAQEFTYARRPSRFRPVNMSGLPSSLSTLRPASLPLPSAMPVRPFVAPQPTDERARVQSVREALLSGIAEGENKRLIMDEIREEPEDEVNEREAEILKLVAASMPSHRSAWKRDSSAWQTFVNRRRTSEVSKAAASEDDDTSNGESAAYYDESEDESEEEPKGMMSCDAWCVEIMRANYLINRPLEWRELLQVAPHPHRALGVEKGWLALGPAEGLASRRQTCCTASR